MVMDGDAKEELSAASPDNSSPFWQWVLNVVNKTKQLFRNHPFWATLFTLWFGYFFVFCGVGGLYCWLAMKDFSVPIEGVAIHRDPAYDSFEDSFIVQAILYLLGTSIGVLFVLFMFFLYPLMWHAGAFSLGIYATIQFPIALGCVALSMFAVRKKQKSGFQIFLAGIMVYMTFIHVSNIIVMTPVGRVLQVDHSDDFPIENVLESISPDDKYSSDDIRKLIGPPLAEGVFENAPQLLPCNIGRIAPRDIDTALIYFYYEESDWGKKRYHYVVFNATTHEYLK